MDYTPQIDEDEDIVLEIVYQNQGEIMTKIRFPINPQSFPITCKPYLADEHPELVYANEKSIIGKIILREHFRTLHEETDDNLLILTTLDISQNLEDIHSKYANIPILLKTCQINLDGVSEVSNIHIGELSDRLFSEDSRFSELYYDKEFFYLFPALLLIENISPGYNISLITCLFDINHILRQSVYRISIDTLEDLRESTDEMITNIRNRVNMRINDIRGLINSHIIPLIRTAQNYLRENFILGDIHNADDVNKVNCFLIRSLYLMFEQWIYDFYNTEIDFHDPINKQEYIYNKFIRSVENMKSSLQRLSLIFSELSF